MHTKSEITREKDKALAKRNGEISYLRRAVFELKKEQTRVLGIIAPHYYNLIQKYGSYQNAICYCETLDGFPEELMKFFHEQVEFYENNDEDLPQCEKCGSSFFWRSDGTAFCSSPDCDNAILPAVTARSVGNPAELTITSWKDEK